MHVDCQFHALYDLPTILFIQPHRHKKSMMQGQILGGGLQTHECSANGSATNCLISVGIPPPPHSLGDVLILVVRSLYIDYRGIIGMGKRFVRILV